MYFVSRDNLLKLLEDLKNSYAVYIPVKKDDRRFYRKYNELSDDIVIGEVRPLDPLKAFFIRARGIVARDFRDDVPHSKDKPFAIVGVKACDLKSLKIQDHVFKDHDISDPLYIKNREENLIISADCTLSIDTCFCLALDVTPYPREDFDINLSQVKNGFIAETGSRKGESLVKRHKTLFEDAKEEFIAAREKQRAEVVKAVESNIEENAIPLKKGSTPFSALEVGKKGVDPFFEEEAKNCVECGACNSVCPTCHCFLLYDQKDERQMARLRSWDSCMLKDFARVAGGANPRAKLWMRLRNRFEKKFDFFPKTAGTYACTGCGRCITACPAKIDIRKVLYGLTESKKR
jgi:ferredoxin